jgi:hypothetical protein
MHRRYDVLVKEIISKHPGATARFVHDELQDRMNWSSRTCPSESQVRYLLRDIGCKVTGDKPKQYYIR